VIGLTTAMLLSRDKRYCVTVIAKHMPGDYDIEYAVRGSLFFSLSFVTILPPSPLQDGGHCLSDGLELPVFSHLGPERITCRKYYRYDQSRVASVVVSCTIRFHPLKTSNSIL
jgi:hypothetical protein